MEDTSRNPIPTTFVFGSKGSEHDKLMFVLVEAVRHTTSELRRHLDRGKRDIEQAILELDNDLTLNSCGILQSTGTSIDQLVAQRHDAIKTLTQAAYHLGYETPTPDLWKSVSWNA